jgi:hypothetical protein
LGLVRVWYEVCTQCLAILIANLLRETPDYKI